MTRTTDITDLYKPTVYGPDGKVDHRATAEARAFRAPPRDETGTADDDWTYRIGKLSPKPGEIVVVRAKCHLSPEMAANLREQMRAAFAHAGHPDQTVMILGDDLDLMLLDPRDCGPAPGSLAHLTDEAKAGLIRAFEQVPPGNGQCVNPLELLNFCVERGCEFRSARGIDRSELIDVTESGDPYRVYMVSGSGGKLVTLGEAMG